MKPREPFSYNVDLDQLARNYLVMGAWVVTLKGMQITTYEKGLTNLTMHKEHQNN